MPPISKDAGRPAVTDLDRLRHRFWIRVLLRDARNCPELQIQSWGNLANALFPQLSDPALRKGNLQALDHVRKSGTNPAAVLRLIAREDLEAQLDAAVAEACKAWPGAKWSMRYPAGRIAAGDAPKQKKEYLEFEADLVAAGKGLVPSSAGWLTACFWLLAQPELPRLDLLRNEISALKGCLGLCTPNREQRLAHLTNEEKQKLGKVSHEQEVASYRRSLDPVIANGNADAFSLLAALVAETFITDQDELHGLHQSAFYEASNRLLSDPLMEDIRSDFERLVIIPILCGGWALPAAFHVSSISAPFITQAEFDEIQREMYLGIRPV